MFTSAVVSIVVRRPSQKRYFKKIYNPNLTYERYTKTVLYLDLIDCYLISKEQYSIYMDDGRVFNNYKTGTAIGAGTAYHYGAHEFTPIFIGFVFLNIKFFCVLLCRSLFVVLSFF